MHLNISHPQHPCLWRVNLLYYEHWTDKWKYFYAFDYFLPTFRQWYKKSNRGHDFLSYAFSFILAKTQKSTRNNNYYALLQISGKYKKYLAHTTNPENVQINYIKLSGFGFNETAILVIVFWNFKVFKYRFDSPKVKWNLICTIGCQTTSYIGS